jgi:hypothetical protein
LRFDVGNHGRNEENASGGPAGIAGAPLTTTPDSESGAPTKSGTTTSVKTLPIFSSDPL